MRDVKDKANDYKTVTALSEFVVSMLPFVPKSKTFISKIPDKSKSSGYISTTAKTVKQNELANAIKTGASIGAVLSGGDTDLQGTIANATAGGLGGATLHEGGKVIKEGTKLVGKISDNVKTNIEKAKYINELKKNPDNWVYETETKPTGKMRGLGLSQTPEMKTETKRVFSPFVDVDNMKSEFASDVFANPKDGSFASSVNQIYQTFGGNDCYPTLEEKAAMLLYLITKNHSFSDGNKRIAASCFLYFLNKNNMLYKNNLPIIDNGTLFALTLLIAESKPEEMEIMKQIVVSVLNKGENYAIY